MISLKKILSEATINSVKKFTKKDIEKLTSYKDFIGFYKSNSKNLNKADVPRIVDEIESLKYLESDYKRGDADRDEVFVAIEEIQDLIKKSLHIKEETLTEAGMNPVKKVVNAILKKHKIEAMKTYASSVRGAHNIINGGYRYEGDYFLGFYGNVPQDVIEKVGAEMKKAGVKDVEVKKGIISADFTKTGLSEVTLTEKKYYVTYNKGRGQGKGLSMEFDKKTFRPLNKPKVFNSYKDAKKYADDMEKTFRNSIGGGTAYWVSDEKMNPIKESELKGYLAADVVDDIVKAIGSKMVKGHVENAPNRNYIYLKLTDIKFGNDVVKMLKSKFGIDAKIDKTFGNIPTVSFASKKVVSEKKSDYEVYHKSYTSAIEAAREYAEKKGYEINNDDAFTKIGVGPRKPSPGKTNRFSIELTNDGKPQRKMLHIQVYGMKNSYELNAYIQ